MAHVLTKSFAVPASGPGAISGYAVDCSCGARIQTSLKTCTESDALAHVAYYTAKESKSGRRGSR